MFNKTTASIFAKFTQDLETVVAREELLAKQAEVEEALAKERKMASVTEGAKASKAITNIMKMLEA